jgi:aspartyl-tRNA(Asn)/glutamyl-tRNA(Gln) amidotransferase subunit A
MPGDLRRIATDLRSGAAAGETLTSRALEAAQAPGGQGGVVFINLYAAAGRQAAAQADARRANGAALSAIDGMPISIKDLFDVAGEPTTAGAFAMRDEPAALRDAEVVRRLRRAGAVIVGKTVMTEFALSGLGLNPHYGTPLGPWDREHARIPGGSSSGAAVSVADGMALAALGSDTGGSVRIPAAFCGLVGFKPTAARVSLEGVFALSPSLDSVGPIAHTAGSCALIDQALTGEGDVPWGRPPRLGVPRHYVVDGLDAEVAAAFAAAIGRLEAAGAQIVDLDFPELEEIPALGAAGGFSPIEGYAAHAELFERIACRCDPRVMNRFMVGREASSQAYIDMLNQRSGLIRRGDARSQGFDALVFPTAPLIPPMLAELESDEAYTIANGRAIRNAAVANILDRCAITIPCHAPGTAPVGLNLMGERGADRRLLALAERYEDAIRGS